MRTWERKKAFTLIELMVAVGIIIALVTIIMASVSMARESTRDKKRVADLSNIEFALALYAEKEKEYPQYPNGVVLGEGGPLDESVRIYNGNTYRDPSSASGEYEYWYDSNFTCTDPGQIVLFVRTMEQQKNANFEEVCTHVNADSAVASEASYVKVLH